MNREKLFAAARMSLSEMHTEEIFRQSGRTGRMIADAVKSAKTGFLTVIVMKDMYQENRVKTLVQNIENITVIHYNPRNKEMMDWETLQATGVYANHKTFIDHEVIYFNHLKLFRVASQYDPKFDIKGDTMTFVDDRT